MNDHVKDMIATGGRALAIIPRSYEEAKLVAADYAKTGMATRDMKTVERITMAIMAGMEVGLPPIAALNNIAIINNRPRIWGAGVPAIAMRTGQLAAWDEKVEGEGDAMMATCLVARRLTADLVIRKEVTFSVADAKQAGLWSPEPRVTKKVWDDHVRAMVTRENQPNDSPWYKYPKRMLQMRARQAFTDLFADAYCGLGIAEVYVGAEADSEMRDVTPADVVVNPLGGDDELSEPMVIGAQMVDVIDETDAEAPTEAVETKMVEEEGQPPPEVKPAPAAPTSPARGIKAKAKITHPDSIKAPPISTLSRWTGDHYLVHLKSWLDLVRPEHGGADYVAKRIKAEVTIRNNLGTPLTEEEKTKGQIIRNKTLDALKDG